jgi:hypothetical protein
MDTLMSKTSAWVIREQEKAFLDGDPDDSDWDGLTPATRAVEIGAAFKLVHTDSFNILCFLVDGCKLSVGDATDMLRQILRTGTAQCLPLSRDQIDHLEFMLPDSWGAESQGIPVMGRAGYGVWSDGELAGSEA